MVTKTAKKTIKNGQKNIKKEIGVLLTNALDNLKSDLGPKKFEKRIRKAAKLISEGIKTGKEKVHPAEKVGVEKKLLIKKKAAKN